MIKNVSITNTVNNLKTINNIIMIHSQPSPRISSHYHSKTHIQSKKKVFQNIKSKLFPRT
jgi:hypothetical protein